MVAAAGGLQPTHYTSTQDALIDVALGLGAPLNKLILNMPAFGNSFNLMDKEKNLPGSSVTSALPTTTTYQQVSTAVTILGTTGLYGQISPH